MVPKKQLSRKRETQHGNPCILTAIHQEYSDYFLRFCNNITDKAGQRRTQRIYFLQF